MFHYKTFQKWKKVNYTIISNHFWMLLLAHNLTYRINLCYCVSTDLYLSTRRRRHIFSRVSTDARSRHTLREEHWLRGTSGGFWGARAISASAFYIFSFCFSLVFLKGHPQWRGSANEMSQPGRARVQRGWREDSAAQSSSFSARLCPLRAKSQPSEPRHQSLRKAPGTSSVIAALAVWIEKCQQDY